MLVFFIVSIVPAFGQNVPAVLGEMQARGAVRIASSTGSWQNAPAKYPVLNRMAIRIGDGSALIGFRDGSRIEFSKNTHAMIDGSDNRYSVTLESGTVSFSVDPASSLRVSTASGTAEAAGSGKGPRSLGVVSAKEHSMDVRSVTGRIAVAQTKGVTKTIADGETYVVGGDSAPEIVKSQPASSAAPNGDGDDSRKKGAAVVPEEPSLNTHFYIIGGLIIVGGAAFALGSGGGGGGGGGTVSPSVP